jgi:predicted NAD/FAD-dependent oxidoreductase
MTSSGNQRLQSNLRTDGGESAISVGIIGAGVAGAGAAYALRDMNAQVRIFEKSRGVCGRAATRRKNGCRYDHGANYIKDADARTTELIPTLGTDGLVDIGKPVWTFEEDEEISSGESREEYKWTWENGMTQLAKRLLAETPASVQNQTRIESLSYSSSDNTWSITDTEGTRYGAFDVVLLTPPAPQTADILAQSEWNDPHREDLITAVRDIDYRTIRTVVLHYPFRESYPWYALVNTDKNHPIGWASREECKTNHVPDGESLFIVQMSPDWSTEHYDAPLETAADDTAQKLAALLDDARYLEYDWADDQGWRYALPNNGIETHQTEYGQQAGLYIAGDWVAGRGRVNEALWNGYDAASEVAEAHL